MVKENAYPAHAYAAVGDTDALSALLPQVVGALNNWDETPLHLAAKHGQTECCRLLLLSGADVNAADYQERTSLMAAAEQGQGDCARLLLAHGANPKIGRAHV